MGSLTAIMSISGSDGYWEGCSFIQMLIITTRKIERWIQKGTCIETWESRQKISQPGRHKRLQTVCNQLKNEGLTMSYPTCRKYFDKLLGLKSILRKQNRFMNIAIIIRCWKISLMRRPYEFRLCSIIIGCRCYNFGWPKQVDACGEAPVATAG